MRFGWIVTFLYGNTDGIFTLFVLNSVSAFYEIFEMLQYHFFYNNTIDSTIFSSFTDEISTVSLLEIVTSRASKAKS